MARNPKIKNATFKLQIVFNNPSVTFVVNTGRPKEKHQTSPTIETDSYDQLHHLLRHNDTTQHDDKSLFLFTIESLINRYRQPRSTAMTALAGRALITYSLPANRKHTDENRRAKYIEWNKVETYDKY